MTQTEKSSLGKRTLAQKLGIKPEMEVLFHDIPKAYFTWIGIDQKHFPFKEEANWNFAHLFLTTTDDLEHWINHLRFKIDTAGMIWVSWNKKSSGISTQLNEDIIRDTALAIGLVDIKVCSVNED